MVVFQVVMQGLLGGVGSVFALISALQRLAAQTAAMLTTFTRAVALAIAWVALGNPPNTRRLLVQESSLLDLHSQLGGTCLFPEFSIGRRRDGSMEGYARFLRCVWHFSEVQ